MIIRFFLYFSLLTFSVSTEAAEKKRPNFLVITIDDLNDYVGCLKGHPNSSTPNLDQLASRGVLFTRAYCNSPVCNPSRASLWTGLRPTTTGVTSNKHGWFRTRPGFEDIVTLPQNMAAAGYATMGFGKLFHLGSQNKIDGEWQRSNHYSYGPVQNPKLNFPTGDPITDWGVPRPGNGQPSYDPDIARRVINVLEGKHDRPVFLGCGFFRPHTPLYADQEWFDQHPLNSISLPPGYQKGDTDDLVYFGKRPRREQDVEAPGLFNQEYVEKSGKWKDILQAYLASTSSMDFQLGRVIKALDKSREFRRNTYVIVTSDHGWDLGEKRHWGKAALWEHTTRVPFIILGPGIPAGIRCDQPVDLLCIYPTVLDFADIKSPHKLAGRSLRPLLENAEANWDHPVVTTFVDHHALRTRRWRYIRYASGEEELYDHSRDPHEWDNLAVTGSELKEVQATLKKLRARLDSVLAQ